MIKITIEGPRGSGKTLMAQGLVSMEFMADAFWPSASAGASMFPLAGYRGEAVLVYDEVEVPADVLEELNSKGPSMKIKRKDLWPKTVLKPEALIVIKGTDSP